MRAKLNLIVAIVGYSYGFNLLWILTSLKNDDLVTGPFFDMIFWVFHVVTLNVQWFIVRAKGLPDRSIIRVQFRFSIRTFPLGNNLKKARAGFPLIKEFKKKQYISRSMEKVVLFPDSIFFSMVENCREKRTGIPIYWKNTGNVQIFKTLQQFFYFHLHCLANLW